MLKFLLFGAALCWAEIFIWFKVFQNRSQPVRNLKNILKTFKGTLMPSTSKSLIEIFSDKNKGQIPDIPVLYVLQGVRQVSVSSFRECQGKNGSQKGGSAEDDERCCGAVVM